MDNQLTEQEIKQIENAIAASNTNRIEDYLIENGYTHALNHSTGNNVHHLMLYLNEAIGGCGIEAICDREVADAFYDSIRAVQYGNCIADYINTGDIYNPTVVYDRIFNRLFLTTLSNYLEEIEAIKAIAVEIKSLVDSGVIEWDEWKNDRLASVSSFPLRLQKYDGTLTLFYGAPDFDFTHAGFWGYYQIDRSDTYYLEYAIDMYDQCLGMELENANS